jgi:hypothetical protein
MPSFASDEAKARFARIGGGAKYESIPLKQLYDTIVQKDAPTAADFKAELFGAPKTDTGDSSNPEDAYNPLGFTGLDFLKMFAKEGGSIHHYSTGSTVDATQSSETTDYAAKIAALKADMANRDAQDLKDTFAKLGEVAPAIEPMTRPTVAQGRHAGSAYAPRPMAQMSVVPQLAAILQRRGMTMAQGGNVADQSHPNYNGIPAFRTGGLEGLGGKYVEGKGDGTSDDIAAMLANGEYVFSADVVAALGNGSNKAGASALDQMVSKIRERARSAPPDKLSPDAKSPLEDLKSSSPAKGAR